MNQRPPTTESRREFCHPEPPSLRSEYSRGEEIANSVTHGIGLAFGIVALVVLLVGSARIDDPWRVVSFSIYGSSLIVLYLTSTLYHAIPHSTIKGWLRRCDHAAIFLFIGGTYTPLMFITLRGPIGWTVAGLIWAIMAAGITLKLLCFARFEKLLLGGYVAMGWSALAVLHVLWRELSAPALGWLFGGGAFYTLGIWFYILKTRRYMHAVWHLFVLGGSVCHFLLFFKYVLPR